MGGNGKHRWKITFYRSNSSSKNPPKELLCLISGSLMSDPVVVTSGQTFERLSVQLCRELSFSPKLEDGTRPDFSTMIPNLAIKSTIRNWCDHNNAQYPQAPDSISLDKAIRAVMEEDREDPGIRVSERELLRGMAEKPPVRFLHAATELGRRVDHFYSSSSEESVVIPSASPPTPLPFATRPSCYSSASSSEITAELETLNPNSSSPECKEEDQLMTKLRSPEVIDQEEGVILLRKLTRTKEELRISLCTPWLLSAVLSLIVSRYSTVQQNAVASLVNLSLEKPNKVKIVRSGFVPYLVDVLKGGSSESQEHAAGALFSLALEEDNKIAIGVLGALPPLMHALVRAESERTRHDSALTLYHLTLVESNRVRLVKQHNAVPTLLTLAKSPASAGRALLILCNLASCNEGRSAMLDANAVQCLVGMLRRRGDLDSESTRENCVAALYVLSHGSMRFRGLAREANAVEVLSEIEKSGSERAREKAKRLLMVMRGGEDEPNLDSVLDSVLDSGAGAGLGPTRYRVGRNLHTANSTTF